MHTVTFRQLGSVCQLRRLYKLGPVRELGLVSKLCPVCMLGTVRKLSPVHKTHKTDPVLELGQAVPSM
jgi:hypothetical protein